MKTSVDLNCDLGELIGDDARLLDAEIVKLVSSVNIACGFHAGNPRIMQRTVELAAKYGVGIGAHPGLADRASFGRHPIAIAAAELYADFLYQIGALSAFANAADQPLQHVKMHGALVEMARSDDSLAQAMCRATRDADAHLIWLSPAGVAAQAATEMGLRVVREFYADRAYHANGSLVSRKLPDAVIDDVVKIDDRITQLFESETVATLEGQRIPIAFESICIHSDTPQALKIAQVVRDVCERRSVAVKSFSKSVD
ncbi:MAG: LamB/YcsF family protein [Pirellulales bacterium]|nr:LamB/YcsF family protein [Pirellulales bacterium]